MVAVYVVAKRTWEIPISSHHRVTSARGFSGSAGGIAEDLRSN